MGTPAFADPVKSKIAHLSWAAKRHVVPCGGGDGKVRRECGGRAARNMCLHGTQTTPLMGRTRARISRDGAVAEFWEVGKRKYIKEYGWDRLVFNV